MLSVLADLHTRCTQLETALLAKVPIRSHLAYVTLTIDIGSREVEYRLAACLWKPGCKPEDHAFNTYTRGANPFVLLDALARDIEVFQLWTPAAIAATLGIGESA